MSGFWQGVAAIVPSVGVGVLFFVAIRYIVRADRNERDAVAQLDREEQLRDATKNPAEG